MHPSFDWLAILLLVGAAHALFLALTLVTIRGGNRTANRILALIIAVFAASIVLHTFAYTHQHLLAYPHLSKIEPALIFLFAPLFYFYVRAMTTPEFRLSRKDLLHFLPFFACVAYLTPYYLQSAEQKISHILTDHAGPCVHCLILFWAAAVQILIYIVAITRRLRQHKQRVKETFSSVESVNLSWLQKMLAAAVLIWATATAIQAFDPTVKALNFVWLLVSANMYLIGYMGLRQPHIFSGNDAAAPRKKYAKSTLTPEKAEEYVDRLKQVMQTEKPFLDANLTLHDLAGRVAISHHHLSQVINEKFDQNFFEFVNRHRVEEARMLLHKPETRHLNIAQIGFEAGFNSISAFNAAFKKHAGTTPSQFLSNLQSSEK